MKADSELQGGISPAVGRVKALSGRTYLRVRLTKVVPRETEPRPFSDEAFIFLVRWSSRMEEMACVNF